MIRYRDLINLIERYPKILYGVYGAFGIMTLTVGFFLGGPLVGLVGGLVIFLGVGFSISVWADNSEKSASHTNKTSAPLLSVREEASSQTSSPQNQFSSAYHQASHRFTSENKNTTRALSFQENFETLHNETIENSIKNIKQVSTIISEKLGKLFNFFAVKYDTSRLSQINNKNDKSTAVYSHNNL